MRYFWFSFSCFKGQVWSWGDGDYGKLGRGGSDGCKTPKLIEKLQDLDIVKVRCGSQFSIALTKDGQVYTWGKGDNQRLGHGTEEHVRYPKLLEGLKGNYQMWKVFCCWWNLWVDTNDLNYENDCTIYSAVILDAGLGALKKIMVLISHLFCLLCL